MAQKIYLGMGCFWKPQKIFNQTKGVLKTSVGFGGGDFQNPTYEDVCYKKTHHKELVEVDFDEKIISFEKILNIFFENHNPTQTDGQNFDIGEQYASCIYYLNESQKKIIVEKILEFSKKLDERIVTEVLKFKNYFLAEEYHQNYLEKKEKGFF